MEFGGGNADDNKGGGISRFDTDKAYEVDDVIIKDNKIYIATVPSHGPFNAAHWTEVSPSVASASGLTLNEDKFLIDSDENKPNIVKVGLAEDAKAELGLGGIKIVNGFAKGELTHGELSLSDVSGYKHTLKASRNLTYTPAASNGTIRVNANKLIGYNNATVDETLVTRRWVDNAKLARSGGAVSGRILDATQNVDTMEDDALVSKKTALALAITPSYNGLLRNGRLTEGLSGYISGGYLTEDVSHVKAIGAANSLKLSYYTTRLLDDTQWFPINKDLEYVFTADTYLEGSDWNTTRNLYLFWNHRDLDGKAIGSGHQLITNGGVISTRTSDVAVGDTVIHVDQGGNTPHGYYAGDLRLGPYFAGGVEQDFIPSATYRRAFAFTAGDVPLGHSGVARFDVANSTPTEVHLTSPLTASEVARINKYPKFVISNYGGSYSYQYPSEGNTVQQDAARCKVSAIDTWSNLELRSKGLGPWGGQGTFVPGTAYVQPAGLFLHATVGNRRMYFANLKLEEISATVAGIAHDLAVLKYDTGQETAQLNEAVGFTHNDAVESGIEVYRNGKQFNVGGIIYKSGTWDGIVGTIPAGFRPSKIAYGTVATNNQSTFVRIHPNGDVEIGDTSHPAVSWAVVSASYHR